MRQLYYCPVKLFPRRKLTKNAIPNLIRWGDLESGRIHVASLSVSTYRSAPWDSSIECAPSANGEKPIFGARKLPLKGRVESRPSPNRRRSRPLRRSREVPPPSVYV